VSYVILIRRRKQVLNNAVSERNRVQKILEEANVKIGSVLTDVFGVSGQLILEALLEGKATVEEIANLARHTAPPEDSGNHPVTGKESAGQPLSTVNPAQSGAPGLSRTAIGGHRDLVPNSLSSVRLSSCYRRFQVLNRIGPPAFSRRSARAWRSFLV
jgi:hypothetical protein